MARARIRLREDDVEPRDTRVRDEALGAVQDVLVAVAPRLGSHGGGVRARAGLRERVGGQPLAARQAREPALLLLVRAVVLDRERAELLEGQDEPRGGAGLGDLLDGDEHHERAGARAAEALLEREAEDLVVAQELDHVPGELALLVDLGRTGRDALAGQGADEVADLALLAGERLVAHGAILVAAAGWPDRPDALRRGLFNRFRHTFGAFRDTRARKAGLASKAGGGTGCP